MAHMVRSSMNIAHSHINESAVLFLFLLYNEYLRENICLLPHESMVMKSMVSNLHIGYYKNGAMIIYKKKFFEH
jgi:hypothetical protein